MAQLGELKKNEAKFEELGVEVIAIFREEAKGVDGLQIIKDRRQVDFTLALDTGAKKTAAYSPGKREFTNYVVDKQGTIQGVIEGDLRNRAKSNQLLEIVSGLSGSSASASSQSPANDKAAVERAVLDYVEGIYDVKPELIERSVHPELKKLGFQETGNDLLKAGWSEMTFDQLRTIAATYNKSGKIPAGAPKEVVVFDVMDKIATAKLTAAWGTDYFNLVKQDGKWKICQIVWQSPIKK